MYYKTIIITFLSLFSFLMSSNLFSQDVSVGLKGGLTVSNLYIDRDDLDDENARFGYHVGLFSQIMFFETFGIQPEILYTTKGSKAKYTGVIDQTVRFNLSYIDIPVLMVLRPGEVLELHAGPYAGLLLSGNTEFSGLIEGESDIDRDDFNTLDYGLAGGLALNFGNVQAGLRYNLGLQKLADTDLTRLLLGDSKNSYGQLYFTIRLN
ncbi:MAG: PorT family protein [Saprospirales bacterium]|nr:MAG: PorT family protein [Saprospirales bacterium]